MREYPVLFIKMEILQISKTVPTGIKILNTAFKAISNISFERLNPHVEDEIGSYHQLKMMNLHL